MFGYYFCRKLAGTLMAITCNFWLFLASKKYSWNPSIEADFRCVFDKVGSNRITDFMSKERKKARKPEFMNKSTWDSLCREWRLPTFIVKSLRGNVITNEVANAVAKETGKATQQLLDAIRNRPV